MTNHNKELEVAELIDYSPSVIVIEEEVLLEQGQLNDLDEKVCGG